MMDNWQANAIIAQHVAELMMDRDEDTRDKAPKRRIRLLPRIDIRGWIARMDAGTDDDRLVTSAVPDVECA